MAKKPAQKEVQILPPNYQEVVIPIHGLTPLLCHAMTEEKKVEILEARIAKQTVGSGGKQQKTTRSIQDEFHDACYHLPPINSTPRYGFPSSGFRLAVEDAARTTELPMTKARMTFLPLVEMVELKFGELRSRIDKVGGSAHGKPLTVCVRAEFHDWSCDLPIEYDADFTSLDVIVNLLHRAGRIIGIGAWAPGKGGLHGRFKVLDS